MPDGWVDAVLGDVADITIGRTPPRDEPRYWTTDLTRPFCTISDMAGGVIVPRREGVTEAAEIDGRAKRMPAGSLLLSFKLTIGRVGIAGVDLFPNEAIARIEPNTLSLDKRYLALWLSAADLLSGSGRAVKGNTLNSASLRAIPVSYPPVAEQRRIVDLIGAIERTVDVSDRLFAVASALLLTLRREAVSAAPQHVLGTCAVVVMGQSPMGSTVNKVGKGEPLLNGPTEFGRASPTGTRQWTTAPERTCESGDVLVCVRGATAGRMNVSDQPYAIGRGLAAVRGARPVDSQWAWHALSARVGALLPAAGGTIFPNISGPALKGLVVGWPDSGKIEQTVDLLNAAESVADHALTARLGAATLRSALLDRLLSGEHEIPASYDRFLDGAP